MNQKKCILDTINKYSDFPGVQADMKKLIKYTESQYRFFVSDILSENLPQSATAPELREDSIKICEVISTSISTEHPVTPEELEKRLSAILEGKNDADREHLLSIAKITTEKLKELILESKCQTV